MKDYLLKLLNEAAPEDGVAQRAQEVAIFRGEVKTNLNFPHDTNACQRWLKKWRATEKIKQERDLAA